MATRPYHVLYGRLAHRADVVQRTEVGKIRQEIHPGLTAEVVGGVATSGLEAHLLLGIRVE
jgi:hypothetical protein